MSQLNSILALKLQRQERMAQQEREDKVQQDATMQASMQHLISGQQRLADQQLARDDWKLKFEQQKYQMELARQKQDLEYQKYIEESRWGRMKDTVEMNKDVAETGLAKKKTTHPTLFRGQTNIGLTSGQKLGLGKDIVNETQADINQVRTAARAAAATKRNQLDRLKADLQSTSLSGAGSSKRDRAWENVAKSYGLTTRDELYALASRLEGEVQTLEAKGAGFEDMNAQLSALPFESMTPDELRKSVEAITSGAATSPPRQTIGPRGAAPQKITAPPPTAPPGGVSPSVQAIYDKHKPKPQQ